MNEMPLQSGPVRGTVYAADPELIARDLRNERNELRISGNFWLADFLNDAFLKRERCIFGIPVEK